MIKGVGNIYCSRGWGGGGRIKLQRHLKSVFFFLLCLFFGLQDPCWRGGVRYLQHALQRCSQEWSSSIFDPKRNEKRGSQNLSFCNSDFFRDDWFYRPTIRLLSTMDKPKHIHPSIFSQLIHSQGLRIIIISLSFSLLSFPEERLPMQMTLHHIKQYRWRKNKLD